jgi:hypothetical protein
MWLGYSPITGFFTVFGPFTKNEKCSQKGNRSERIQLWFVLW